ncbi:MAG: SecDF P1 head subdomain-containing protein, partial [Bacteroidota bacterium]
MKGNGTKLAFIVAFLALTIYYLFPSFQYWLEMRNVDNMPEEERVEYMSENEVRIENMREEVLTLGLDLQGGMHVTLELATNRLIRELSGEYADDFFNEILSFASQRARENNTDVIDEFVMAFEEEDEDARLSRYFRSDADNITRRSTNDEIQMWLQEQRDAAVERAIEIVRNRVDRFGVTEPSIVRQGNNRLVVELPGVTDEQRVRDLLRGTARLEFRLTADPDDLRHSLERIIAHFEPEEDEFDLEEQWDDIDMEGQDNPLLDVMMPQGQGVTFGSAAGPDTAEVNRLLSQQEVQRLLPRDITLMWTANPQFDTEGQSYYSLIGVRRQVELTGDVVTEARPTFDQHTNRPEVSMTMNRQGARIWARVTGANIGRPIAIALDGVIYS